MLRKILNILIVLVIVALIGVVLLNLYNKSKLESNDFTNSVSEKAKDTDNKKKTDKKDKTDTKEKSNNKKDVTNSEDSSLDGGNEDSSNNISNEGEIESSPVSVESTSSYRNDYVAIIGSVVILLGFSSIIVNKN